jgi:hypothetical protein
VEHEETNQSHRGSGVAGGERRLAGHDGGESMKQGDGYDPTVLQNKDAGLL